MENILTVKQKYSLREKLIVLLFDYSKNLYRIFIKRNKKSWDISIDKLVQYKQGTLGKDLGVFLKEHDFQIEPKFEKHDIYHVLTEYPTTVIGEVCLSVFNVGSGKRSLYTGGVALLGALLLVEEYQTFVTAYKRGKASRNYTAWDFEYLLNENTEELKKLIFRRENDLEIFI